MSLSIDEIKKLGHLARIKIPDTEINELQHDLENTLELVAKMNSVDTSNVQPMAHPLDETQRLRADQVTEPDQCKTIMQIAPESSSGLYIVPKFVETE